MKVAQFIPAPVRKVVYTVLGTLFTLEAIFDVIPDVLEGTLLQALAALGFVVAVSNTPDH